MRVAFVLWPISEEGGLATRAHALVNICNRAEIEANFYRLHYSDTHHGTGRTHVEVTTNVSGLRVEGRHLSITDTFLSESLHHLSKYDALVFVHPAPHVTDRAVAVKNWRKLFTDLPGEKIAYFTDVYARDYYPWIEEVAGLFRPVCVNDAIARYLKDEMDMDVPVVPHPFPDLREQPFSKHPRDKLVIWTCAWRGWKGIKRFVAATPNIEGEVRLYGTGREYRQLRKENRLGEVHGQIMGACPPEQLNAAYAHAYASVDLTGQSPKYFGHYNRTTIEPMIYGAVSVTLPTIVEPYSRIPEECVWVVDKNEVAASINNLLDSKHAADKIRENAYAWVRDTCEDTKVLEAIFGNLWSSKTTQPDSVGVA